MKTVRYLVMLSALLILMSACTKKTNLTGDNFSEIDAQLATDYSAVWGGYSFPADSLVSLDSGRKNLLVGSWQGSEARSIIRFTGLPDEESMLEYDMMFDAELSLVLAGRDKNANALTLKIYKVLRSYTLPDSLAESDCELWSNLVIPAEAAVNDTLVLDLDTQWLKTWASGADSTGLNILIALEDGAEGFAELKLASANSGSRISYKYLPEAGAEEQELVSYATNQAYSFSHPEVAIDPDSWRLSNFAPQRMYIDLNPDFELFEDQYGNVLSPEDLKRVNINKAELVLFTKKDLPNLQNTYSYFVSALLVKEKPESPIPITVENMEAISFAYSLVSSTNTASDSLVINITPIIQAYSSGKKEPQGIVIISNYERKDFGEIEFYNPNFAPAELQPYIRVKYTPPFL